MSQGQDTQQVSTGSTRIAESAASTPAQPAPRHDLADDDDDRVLANDGQSRPDLGLGEPSRAATSPSPIPITRSLRRSSRRIPSATYATPPRDPSTAARAQDGPIESSPNGRGRSHSHSPSHEPRASTSISSSFISPSSFESPRHPWHDAKYRDTIERAQNKGDPSSWGVLHAAMVTSGYGAGPASAGTSGVPPLSAARDSASGERDRTSARSQSKSRSKSKSSRQNIVKTASQSNLPWLSSAFCRHDTSLSSAAERDAAVLTEEPYSYAQVRPDHDEHGDEQGLEPTPKNESALRSSPRREPRRHDHPASRDEASDTDCDGVDRPRGRSRRRWRRSRSPVHSSSSSSTTSEHHGTFIKRDYSKLLPLSTLQKNIIKCVLAYFIAELFTFVPILTEWLGSPWDVDGPVRNAHVVATVAVYFYPARTIGSMFEADCFMFLGAMYATFLCCGSMAMSVWLASLGHEQLAHAVVLIFWLGGGYTILAYAKTSVNKPSFTTACSMVSLITSVIITKEGAFHIGRFQSQAILQVLLIVACGSGISNAVCFLLWPMSATSKLQGDLNKTLASFSTLLDMLTKTFLLDDDITTRPVDLVRAVDQHQASFTTLKSSVAQAKFETFDARMSATTASYDEVVRIMTRLAQGLTGMRAGCTLQYDLIKARADGILVFGKDAPEASIPKTEEAKGLMEELVVFEKFKERVRPSLETLSSLSCSALSLLRTSFVQTKAGSATRKAIRSDDPETGAHLLSADDLLALKQELDSSLVLFKREHSRAIKILYRSLPAQTIYGPGELQKQQDEETPFTRESLGEPENDGEEGPNESLFRVYHYCFNVEEWAKELSQLIEVFVEIRTTEEIVERKAIDRRRRWGPLAGVAAFLSKVETSTRSRPSRRGRRSEVAESTSSRSRRWYSWLATLPSDPGNGPFPVIVDGALSSHQFPSSQLTRFGAFKQHLWIIGYRLRQPSVKFAIKTGAGAALLASAAFVPQLRPVWIRWRGEWALISYMVIMAPVVGGTNFLAFGRVLGTLAGGVLAVLCYISFPENPIALPLLGALVSVPCFYVIVTRPQFGPSSRFVLLTFNLTCLYAFNLREADTHPASIAFHRTVAVSVGVVYALIVNTYIWPFEARRELRKGLSDFFLNSAYLYERIVRTYSVPPPALTARANHSHLHPISDGTVDERTSLISTDAQEQLEVNEDEFVAMEVHLQLSLIKLQGLLSATSHEPRLKGPFPIAPYQTILSSCQTILDLLTSIQQVTNREAWFTTVRRDFVIPANPERREMVGNVLLYFSLLASASTLKTPMPPFLPPAKEAREQLVKRLRTLPVVKRRLVRGGSEGLLYLGYALTMKDVIAQLDLLGATFQSLFGIIGGATSTASFEALFTDEPVDSESTGRDDSSDEETPNPV